MIMYKAKYSQHAAQCTNIINKYTSANRSQVLKNLHIYNYTKAVSIDTFSFKRTCTTRQPIAVSMSAVKVISYLQCAYNRETLIVNVYRAYLELKINTSKNSDGIKKKIKNYVCYIKPVRTLHVGTWYSHK